MKFRPILYSTQMVQAIQEGRKTMTRRIVKPQPPESITDINFGYSALTPENFIECRCHFIVDGEKRYGAKFIKCPYGKVGDVLWVREKIREYYFVDEHGYTNFDKEIIEYAADNPKPLYFVDGDGRKMTNKDGSEKFVPWKPSIFMPKSACRIFLEITNVRVERLQDISEQDAVSEGIKSFRPVPGDGSAETQYYHYLKNKWGPSPIHSFQTLWQKINGPESWEANPFVWVISFKSINKPENSF